VLLLLSLSALSAQEINAKGNINASAVIEKVN
jgi:hypothetical protein